MLQYQNKEKNEIRPVSIRTSENEEYIIEKSPSPCSCYVKQGNKEGYTPLHFAVMSGSKECVELLLAEGADYSERNVDNETSLDIAIKHNHQEIIQI